MVERLTDKNLSLGEEATELRSQVRHLEQVANACEDIEAEHQELEEQLQRTLIVMSLVSDKLLMGLMPLLMSLMDCQ